MDKEQEKFQSMNFFGIYIESYKLIVSWKNFFSQITLALIFPLFFIILAKIQLSEFLFPEFSLSIFLPQIQLSEFLFPEFYHYENIPIRSSTTSELVAFWLFEAVYFIFNLSLSLLFTSAVVYTINCIYTSKLQMITFTKVTTVVPKVWKRLVVTSLWYYMILLVYIVLGALVVALVDTFTFLIPQQVLRMVILFILRMCYVIGSFCMRVVTQLVNVVSVLEDIYGINAIIKSKELIKGKMWVASFTYLAIQVCLTVIPEFVSLVVHTDGTEGGGLVIGSRLAYVFLDHVLFSVFSLIEIVTQTVIYFVCKSYHHENIDKSCLADHQEEVYTWEYVQLESSDV